MPKLSIIVPAYNAENYLKKCLDSLLNQTIKDIEVLIVNDESTDNTQAIIDEYVSKYPNICKSFTQKHSGQAIARNLAIKNATGEFITFIDSDDFVEDDIYAKVLNKAETENLDIVCFDYYEIIDDKKIVKEHYIFNIEDNTRKYIVSESSPWNKVIRRKLLLDSNFVFLENRIYEDLATIPTLAKFTKKIAFLPDRLYNYVIHENSTMRCEKYNSKLEDIFYVVDSLYNDFIDTEYKEELEYLYIEHLLHAANLRFINYKEGIQQIKKVSRIMKEKFPNWRKNTYFRKSDIKYKIICNLLFCNKVKLVKLLLNNN